MTVMQVGPVRVAVLLALVRVLVRMPAAGRRAVLVQVSVMPVVMAVRVRVLQQLVRMCVGVLLAVPQP